MLIQSCNKSFMGVPYLTIIRPDLLFATRVLWRFMQDMLALVYFIKLSVTKNYKLAIRKKIK